MTLTRIALLACLCSVVAVPRAGAAQERPLTIYGSATNLGYGGQATGSTAEIELKLASRSGGSGELTVYAPLAGSGSARAWVWSDTLLVVSQTPEGEQILWVASPVDRSPRELTGRYVVLTGPFAWQRGTWQGGTGGATGLRLSGSRPKSLSTIPLQRALDPQLTPEQPKPVVVRTGSAELATAYSIAGGAAFLVALFSWFRTRRRQPKRTDRYAVKCPTCQVRQVETGVRFFVIRGKIVSFSHGERRLIGCTPCVQKGAARELALNALLGWWCFPWGALTPFVLIGNVTSLLFHPRSSLLEELLQEAGVDPASVRVGTDGLTGEQRATLVVARIALAEAVRADGHADEREWSVAAAAYSALSGGRIPVQKALEYLRSTTETLPAGVRVPEEIGLILLEALVDVAVADGRLAQAEVDFLRSVSHRLGLGKEAADAALGRRVRRRQGSSNSNDQRQSKQARVVSDMVRAAEILGVEQDAPYSTIRDAWRAAIMTHHPDRAGTDAERRAAAEAMSKNINWAHDTLKRHATAAV